MLVNNIILGECKSNVRTDIGNMVLQGQNLYRHGYVDCYGDADVAIISDCYQIDSPPSTVVGSTS